MMKVSWKRHFLHQGRREDGGVPPDPGLPLEYNAETTWHLESRHLK